MVPFFRAVRTEEGGCEATPQGGRSPPIDGREATLILQGVALRSYVFLANVALNVDRFGRNLAGMIFGQSRTNVLSCFLIWPPGGRVIKCGKQKNGIFGHFQEISKQKRVSEGARGPLEVAEDLLDPARVGPVRLKPSAAVCDQH